MLLILTHAESSKFIYNKIFNIFVAYVFDIRG